MCKGRVRNRAFDAEAKACHLGKFLQPQGCMERDEEKRWAAGRCQSRSQLGGSPTCAEIWVLA